MPPENQPAVDERVVYIHGVEPSPAAGSHKSTYQTLHNGIRAHRPGFPAGFIGAEWGWNHEQSPAAEGHELLTTAQAWLGQKVMSQLRSAPFDFTINPLRLAVNRLRDLMFYGFGDMFYYVSADGKNSIRYAVAAQVVRQLSGATGEVDHDRPISLTVLGHSAGSVVAFDLLFYLFVPGDVKMCTADANQAAFIQERHVGEDVSADVVDKLKVLREMAKVGRVRLRRLYTFGSPLAMLAIRSNHVLELYAGRKPVDPAYHGLTQNPPAFGEGLKGPRWINIWDRDDPIGWPATALVDDRAPDGSRVAVDEYVNVSSDILEAHNRYWSHSRVHQVIARHW